MIDPVLLARVQHMIADIFGIHEDSLTPESSPDTVEAWDSIQHLNIVVALEQEFGVQIAPEEIEQMLSIELIAALMEEKRKGCGVAYGGR